MLFNEKIIHNADLVIPFNGCQFGEPVSDCPFIKFWDVEDPDERIGHIATLREGELEKLRTFHRECILAKVKHAQENLSYK